MSSAIVAGAQGAQFLAFGGSQIGFTSASYLSFNVPCTCASGEFGTRRSLGMPAWFARDVETRELERELAALTGHEDALVEKSTFHALVDMMQMAKNKRADVWIEENAYVLSHRAAATVYPGEVHMLSAARSASIRQSARGARPWVFLDGWDLRGPVPPLQKFSEEVRRKGGLMIVDDTQALGLLGERAARASSPLLSGGQGTLVSLGIGGPSVVLLGSLGKAFGVPLAFVAGSSTLIAALRKNAPLYRASSPPDLSLVRAARSVLRLNQAVGMAQRTRLQLAINALRFGANTRGPAHSPVQSWDYPTLGAARQVWNRLKEQGVWALLGRSVRGRAAVTFLVTVAHEGPPMARALAVLSRVERSTRW